jgi:glycosyltransferase involved in cell wall biosynthesis
MPAGSMPASFAIEAHPAVGSPSWLSKASFDVAIPAHLARQQPDIVWTRNVAAAVWCTRAGLPTVFETYRPDLATDWRFMPWRRAVLGSPHLRGVIHHSATAAEAFGRAGVPAARRLVARNGFAPSWMEPRLDRDAARLALDLPGDRPLVVYAGDVHPAKGIDTLVRLAAAVPDVRILVLGASDETAVRRIEAMARAAGAANVLVRTHVRIGEVAPYLYAADCLVIPPPAEPMERSRTVLPIKTFLYLAAGRAILAPRRADFEEVLTDGVTARLVALGDVRAAARALRALLADDALRDRLGRNALDASAQYTWAHRAQSIVGFLRTIQVPELTR